MTIRELIPILLSYENHDIEVFIQEKDRRLARIETVVLDESGNYAAVLGE